MKLQKTKKHSSSKANEANKLMKLKAKQGFAILYAVLVSSILLAIGLAIFNITIKELLFSSLGRESQFAFYAADTGAECALYWDLNGDAFATSTTSNINCVEMDILAVGGKISPSQSVFTLYLDSSQSIFGPCAIVSVEKFEAPEKTIIESRGYNTCDTNNPRRVERGIRVTY